MDGTRRPSRSFWIGLGAGLVPMAWGVRLYLDATPDLRRRLDLPGWMLGLNLAHDVLLAPMALAVGWVVARIVPSWARASAQAACIATAAVLLVGALPAIGSAPEGNDTIQPLDHAAWLAVVVVSIWAAAGATAVVRRRSSPGCGRRTRNPSR